MASSCCRREMEAWFWSVMVRSCPDVYLQHCEALVRVMTGLLVNEPLQRHTFARLLYSKATLSLQFFKGLKFKLRIVARMSSGASMLRKSQISPAGIQTATGFPLSTQRCLNLIRLDSHGRDWNRGPVPVTIIPPYTVKMSVWIWFSLKGEL